MNAGINVWILTMHVDVVMGDQLDEHLLFWQPTISIILCYCTTYCFRIEIMIVVWLTGRPNESKVRDCSVQGADSSQTQTCRLDRTSLGPCDGLRDPDFGYAAGEPCVLLKLNKVTFLYIYIFIIKIVHKVHTCNTQLKNKSLTSTKKLSKSLNFACRNTCTIARVTKFEITRTNKNKLENWTHSTDLIDVITSFNSLKMYAGNTTHKSSRATPYHWQQWNAF